MKHILISGIPGTGKTKIGEKLALNYGFIHIDFEDEANLKSYYQNIQAYTDSLLKREKVVITWGFLPEEQAAHVLELKRRGFMLIWFDGNRPAAFREYMKRGTVDEIFFHIQMWRILSSNIIETIQPTLVNTFDADGNFRKKDDIIKESLKHENYSKAS